MANSIPFNQRDQLPQVVAVYRVYSDSRLLYVGGSINLKNRFCKHHKLAQFHAMEATHITWQCCDNVDLASLEAQAIRDENPLLNDKRGRKAKRSLERLSTNIGFRPTPEDEAMLIAIRNVLPGRPTTADVVRHALKITCDTCKLSIEVTEQA